MEVDFGGDNSGEHDGDRTIRLGDDQADDGSIHHGEDGAHGHAGDDEDEEEDFWTKDEKAIVSRHPSCSPVPLRPALADLHPLSSGVPSCCRPSSTTSSTPSARNRLGRHRRSRFRLCSLLCLRRPSPRSRTSRTTLARAGGS